MPGLRLLAACLLPIALGACSHGLVTPPSARLTEPATSLAALRAVPLAEDVDAGSAGFVDDGEEAVPMRRSRKPAASARTRTVGVEPSAVLRYAELDRARWRNEKTTDYLTLTNPKDAGATRLAAAPPEPPVPAAQLASPPARSPVDTAQSTPPVPSPGPEPVPVQPLAAVEAGGRGVPPGTWSDPPARLSSR